LLWNPVVVIAGYLVAAIVIAVSRWFVPNLAFAEAAAGEPVAVAARPEGDNDAEALAAAA